MCLRRITVVFLPAFLFSSCVWAHGLGANGSEVMDWHTEEISRVVASSRTYSNFGLTVIGDEPGRVVDIDDRRCLQGSQFNFDVENVLAFDIDETIEIVADFNLATTSGSVYLSYDKNGKSAPIIPIGLSD